MSKSSALVKNTLIIALGKLSTQFLTFLLLPVYTIFLSPTAFGQIDLIVTYLALLGPTLTMQMEMAVFRHLIDARGDEAKTRLAISSSSLVMLVGALAGSILILTAGLIFNVTFTWYLVGFFLAAVFVNYLFQVARGLGRNDMFAYASIAIGLTNIAVTCLALIVFRAGIEGVLLAGILGNVVGIVFLLITVKYVDYCKVSGVRKPEIKKLIEYSWPLIPNHISLWGVNGISRTIVVVSLGLAAMGIYAIAARFSLIYTSLYSIFAMSWTEAVSVHMKEDRDNFISKTTDIAVRLFGGLSIIIVALVSLIFPLLAHSDFSDARQYVPLLILGAFLSSQVTHYGAIYLAMRKTKQIAVITVQAMVISTILTLVLIVPIGLYAPALAIVLTYGYLVVLRHRDVQQYVEIRYNKFTYPALTVFAVIVTFLYYLNDIYASILALIVGAIGFVMMNRKSLGSIKDLFIGKFVKKVKG